METNLKVTLRDSIGSAESRRLRNDGSIPAVIYGMGMLSLIHISEPTRPY